MFPLHESLDALLEKKNQHVKTHVGRLTLTSGEYKGIQLNVFNEVKYNIDQLLSQAIILVWNSSYRLRVRLSCFTW